MLISVSQNVQSALLLDTYLSRKSPELSTLCDARVAVAVMTGDRIADAGAEERAIARLNGLPCRVTAMIVKRHVVEPQDCPIDEAIVNILLEFENEGVFGPSS